jgi:LPXTG-site transpeptidase (sortase) family protein
MTQPNDTKKYPATTDEVAKLLGLEASGHGLPMSSIPQADLPVANLPTVGIHSDAASEHAAETHLEVSEASTPSVLDQIKNQPAYLKIAKTVLPFVGIFTVGIFLYYFFFSSVNFNTLFKNTTNKITNQTVVVTAPQQTALQDLQKQDLTSYNNWISGFYYDVSDPKIIDPDTDNSGNGLSNFQKYLLNLNPKSYDTLGLGMADSQALASGINPLSGAVLTEAQKDIVTKYFDLEVIMNKLTLTNLQNPGQIAGAVTNPGNLGLRGLPEAVNAQPQVQGLNTNFVPVKTGLNSDDDKSADIDYKIPGHLDIPSLNVAVPIVWSQDTNTFEQDLQSGVIHYPGTAVPGQIGTTYLAGHSSNYFWAKGNYNQVFTQLGNLKDNASFSVSITDKNGKLITYHYVVVSRKEYVPTDSAQIANTGKSLVALSTCWPINSTAKRLVVYGQLTQVEK